MEGPKITLIEMPKAEIQQRMQAGKERRESEQKTNVVNNKNLLDNLLAQAFTLKPQVSLTDILKPEETKETEKVQHLIKVEPPREATPIAIPQTVILNSETKKPVEKVEEKKYETDSECFNPKQNMLTTISSIKYNHDVDLSGLSEDQRKAVDAVLLGKNILLTGPAGTGKSYTIQKIKEIFQKMKRNIAITAMTGVSAILVEGNTIHSWAGIGICGTKETALNRVMTYKGPQDRIKSAHTLIIDEASMLAALHLDILDYVFKAVRQNNEPFGGIQIILSGDFYQLSPVKQPEYCFSSPNFDQLIHQVCELSFIFRQDNKEFCEALNEVRIGEVSQKTKDLFATCIGKEFEGDIKPTELYPLKVDVENFNDAELWKLASEKNPIREIAALDEIIEKPAPKKPHSPKQLKEWQATFDKNCMAPKVLSLAVHAQVMLIKNLDVEAGLCNGSRGVITGFSPSGQPIVKFRNNQILYMQTQVWTMRLNETARIRRTQYPIVLSWASTIHKAQGMTIDCVRMDLGGRIFANSMTYTALSRARSLEGLSIIDIDWEQVHVDRRVKEFYAKHKK
jgi:ATP-dependent DNA helicase PIF1